MLTSEIAGGGTALVAGIEAALKAYGRSLDLDMVGIASAAPFPQLEATLASRARLGMYPPFTETDAARRADPQRWLRGARSLVVAGLSYHVDAPGTEPRGPADAPRGLLSRYCRGRDYHDLLHQRLRRLTDWLDERAPGHRHAIFVDTGPAADREVAARAGLGWFGRHTNLITREHGSWVVWGEIVTTLSLVPDPPFSGTCGSCRRCVDACPTGAILDLSGTLDPRLCISYTTQMKGAIPAGLRAATGNLVFGCDICQDVCPYNHAATPGDHPEFHPNPELGADPDLGRLLRMTKGQFRRWFRGSAAAWRGRVTLRRNAAVALGNSRDERALPLLGEALRDRNPLVRAHAAWGLGQLAADLGAETEGAAGRLLAARRSEEAEPAVIAEIDQALGRTRTAGSRGRAASPPAPA